MFLEERDDTSNFAQEFSEVEALSGKLKSDTDEERLAHSILENDEQTVQDGKVLAESVDYALGSFTPDMMFEQLVQNYRNAQRLFGPTIIRELTGYEGEYIEKNLKIVEFKKELKDAIGKNIDRLKKEGLINEDGVITEEGLHLASLVLYTEELDHLRAHGIGKRERKERSHYGERDEPIRFAKHRYKDVDIMASVTRAIRRGRQTLEKEDLVARSRKQHGKISIVYAIDASGSMRGDKIHTSKRAGIALAYRAIQDGNDVGLVVFTSSVDKEIRPTQDFPLLLRELTSVRAGQETDLALAIEHAARLFDPHAQTKHLVLITDALPTRGKEPGELTLRAVSSARDEGITISLVGITLEAEGEKLAKRIVELSAGRLYRVTNLANVDLLVLEEYEAVRG